ncbi:MAG TPA: hypothetical protein VIT91_09610 [Chthoniobacterales bacterium]
MPTASEIQLLGANLAIWSTWCSKSKVDLFSTAIALPGDGGLVLVDPIALSSDALTELVAQFGAPKTILLTSSNHERDTLWFVEKFREIRVLAHPDACPNLDVRALPLLVEAFAPHSRLRIVELPGAAPGEVGILIEDSRTLILGDILINLNNFGFGLLPDKYATAPKQLRQSLHKIASIEPKALLFAHGPPILSNAHTRLVNLMSQIQT